MCAADSGSIRQREQRLDARGHHGGIAFEQLATSAAEHGVAAEEATVSEVAHMVEGMAGGCVHGEAQGGGGQVDRVTAAHEMGDSGDPWVVRRVYRTTISLTQLGDAASMIAVMVGDENGCQCQAMRVEIRDDRRRFARVNGDGVKGFEAIVTGRSAGKGPTTY